ncbi:hypothetical protein RRG08_058481 [Elysia crispata]|uniref:Uncharacterized protein n=1 Tax=Elysia crispata TaxID=231223 RepID=A0AAE1CTU6_9GAST|nr:hypothetical protein RRG08_058481 [Elysia crispata]
MCAASASAMSKLLTRPSQSNTLLSRLTIYRNYGSVAPIGTFPCQAGSKSCAPILALRTTNRNIEPLTSSFSTYSVGVDLSRPERPQRAEVRTVKLKEIRIRMVFRDNFLENRQEETELATYSGHTSSDTDGRNH